MTDRSNSGPVRRPSPSVSTENRKPYSRTGLKGVLGTLDLNSGDTAVPTPSDSPYYPFHVETPQLEAPTQNRTSVPNGTRDIVGFPTYEQFRRIEGEYLSSLSERKQPKALISQALFDKILAVLQNGSEDRGSTAQFRFWVRKMFTLVYPQTSFNHNAGQTTEPVVLHDKRPVAIKEQLYEVLCYCHAVARHGGRDKTCATLRLNYSWVPKDLTAKFVKACPTCTLKRSGNPDLLSQFGSSSPYAPPPPPEPASLPVFPGGPNDSPPPALSFVVGSEGCDDGGSAGFGPSMFTTPDLSVYPSPTLSAGSLGPATPSPYLPSGLFGYPAVFDPGHHGSLSSVAGCQWDAASALSPCGLMYPEDFAGISEQQEAPVSTTEEISCTTPGMQLHLPTSLQKVVHPLCARAHSGDCDNGGGGGGDDDIDPALLLEGEYSPFTLVGPTQMATADDAEADTKKLGTSGGPGGDGTGGGGSDGPYLEIFNLTQARAPTRSESSSSNSCSCLQHQNQHQYSHARRPPLPQLGLALGSAITTPAIPPRQRRLQLLSPPSHEASSGTTMITTMATATGDACSGSFSSDRSRDISESLPSRGHGDNPLMNMIMFKFAPSPPTGTGTDTVTGPHGIQAVAAPTPTPTPTATIPTAAGVATAKGTLGMRMEIEERAEENDNDDDDEEGRFRLRVRLEDTNVFDTEAQIPMGACVGVEMNVPRGNQEAAAAGARCRYQCQWDSPEAWLVQSDSIDQDVSVAAVV